MFCPIEAVVLLGFDARRVLCRGSMKPLQILSLIALLFGCGKSAMTGSCPLAVGGSPARGPQDAWVTMIEFADFQCPYCGQVVPTLDALASEYPDDLRLVFKNLPLSQHHYAMSAAMAARCAMAQDRFWEMYELLFANQQHLTDDDLTAYATQIGLDMDAWNACRAQPSPDGQIAQDQADAKRAGVMATPTFFVNGKPLVGALPIEDFRTEIDAARSTAVAAGVDRSSYYATLIATQACSTQQP